MTRTVTTTTPRAHPMQTFGFVALMAASLMLSGCCSDVIWLFDEPSPLAGSCKEANECTEYDEDAPSFVWEDCRNWRPGKRCPRKRAKAVCHDAPETLGHRRTYYYADDHDHDRAENYCTLMGDYPRFQVGKYVRLDDR